MKKTLGITIAAVLGLIIGSAAAAVSYAHSEDYTSEVFPDGLTVNGFDCSGLTYEEAAEGLGEYWNSQKMIVVGKLDEPLAEYTDFGYTYDIADELAKVKSENRFRAALNHYLHIPFSVQIAMRIKDGKKEFKKTVTESAFLSHGNATETKDAYVDMTDPAYPIVPEVYGNKPDTEAYYQGVRKGIELGKFLFKFDEKDYIDIPEIKSDDPDLLNYQRCCIKYLNQKITYTFGEDKVTLTNDDIRGMLKSIESGEADKKEVAKYVKKLAEKYNTVGESIQFTSFTGKTFSINGGTYGWRIDEAAETKKLAEDINSHKDVTREPVYAQKGNGTYSKLVGDTYIDIDLSRQHAVYFENGKIKFETDIVTGSVAAGHSTPTGIFQVLNKLRNITLKGGSKKQHTYYESFVNYWIGFYGAGYGMHDATWRNSFGGDIYESSGSHGCVNMPPSKIPALYNMVSIGTPVIVHY